MAKFLLAAALILLAWMGLRRWQGRHRASYIDRYPFQKHLDARLAARHPELTSEERQAVFAGLLDYFHLCRSAGRRQVAMPSQAVDDAWHEFILFTRRYQAFCQGAFGRFLHHTPAEAMRSLGEAQEGIRRAWRLACQREGIDPKAPDRLPRLFALDAQLGIAGGFVYHLNCMTGKGSTPDGYCASHIGCGGGSGCSSDGGDSSGCSGGCGGGD